MGVGISDLPVTPEINGEIGAATVKSIPAGIQFLPMWANVGLLLS